MSNQEGSSPELDRMPSILAGVILTLFVLIAVLVWASMSRYTATANGSGIAAAMGFLMFAPGIYWLYCVYKFHDAIEATSGYNHPISSSRAVAFHFIPVFNVYWVFKWPSAIAQFVNWRMQRRAMHGWIAGVLVLSTWMLTQLLGIYGMFALYAAGFYISWHLRRAFLAPEVPEEARESMVPGVLKL